MPTNLFAYCTGADRQQWSLSDSKTTPDRFNSVTLTSTRSEDVSLSEGNYLPSAWTQKLSKNLNIEQFEVRALIARLIGSWKARKSSAMAASYHMEAGVARMCPSSVNVEHRFPRRDK